MPTPEIVRRACDPRDIEAGLIFARQWREENRAAFDALYPPRPRRRRCLACNGRGTVLAAQP